jgi:protein-arginine kinase
MKSINPMILKLLTKLSCQITNHLEIGASDEKKEDKLKDVTEKLSALQDVMSNRYVLICLQGMDNGKDI